MAVQAQYPANILFLNNRNGQENTKNIHSDGSLQHQLDIGGDGVVGSHGLFFDGSQMFFNSNGNAAAGGGISRKRGRGEMTVAANTSAATNANVNTNINPFNFSLHNHHHQPQIIDLTQLQNQSHQQQQQPPPNGVSTGLRLSFGEQQKQHHHHIQQRRQQDNHNHNNQNLISSDSSFLRSVVSDEFANEIKRQNHDLNQFIQVQGEHLRSTLAEKRQTHYRALLEAAEEMVCRRLSEKDAEVLKAVRCNAELEARAAQLTAEAQVWQARAQARESEAATLQAQLQQAMLGGGGGGRATAADKEGVEGAADDAESAHVDPERASAPWNRVGPICKGCRRRAASLVVLPCRHLCVCAECDAVVRACPVCLSARSGSIQVYLT